MGIRTGTATYTRFFVPMAVGDEGKIRSLVTDRLQLRAFQKGRPEAVSMGFCTFDDPSRTLLDPELVITHGCILLGFRLDERLYSPLTMKLELRNQLMRYRLDNLKAAPKEERKAIALAIRDALIEEAPPRPRHHAILWNTTSRLLLFESTNRVLLRRFSRHFFSATGCVPVPLFHAQWADKKAAVEPHIREALRASIVVDSPTAIQSGRNLGYGFLAWLYVGADEGLLDGPAGEPLRLRAGDSITLCRPGDRERISCTGAALIRMQVRMAMQHGFLIQRMRLVLSDLSEPENQYGLSLDASLAAVEGLTFPRSKLPSANPDRLTERIGHIERVHRVLDALYARYLTLRLGGGWSAEIERIREWCASATRTEGE